MRILLVFLFLAPQLIFAQIDNFEGTVNVQFEYKNKVYNEHIQSVAMFKTPNPASAPVLYLGGGGFLKLSFDDLSMELHDINYRIIHCDSKWKPSDLDYYRYAEGIDEGFITNYNYSRCMNQRYINYSLTIPNEEIQITASGNYLIQVYRNNNVKDMLLTYRFYVVETKVGINVDVHRAFDPTYRSLKQEVDFTIDYKNFNLVNPNQTVKVALLQNWRYDNAKTELKPNFMGDSKLIYNYEEENTFWGGNEQRFIDITNFNLKSEFVEGFVRRPDTVHVFVEKATPRIQHTLMERRTNMFGNKVYGLSGSNNVSIDPDYAMVYFYILSDYEEPNGDYYVFGGLSNFEHSPQYKMQYNPEKKRYQLRLYLKQGIYNWHFHYMNERGDAGDLRPIEGTFSETLNKYSVLVYYKGITDDYDRLIGISTVEYPTLNAEER